MDDLIIRVLGGHASPFEVERLKKWRGKTLVNETYYQEVARVWELTAPELAAPSSDPPPVDVVLKTSVTAPRRQHGKGRGSLGRWGLLAASLAAVVVGVRVVGPAGPEPFASHQAPEGESLTVTLADGTLARLAPGSHLEEYDIPGGREVSLHGRGFFAVHRDDTRPFTVRSGPGEVRVLGTRFEVSEETGGVLRTLVAEGRVSVSNSDGSVEIGAGEMAQVMDGSPPVASEPEDVYALLDWPDGILVFQGTRLVQVAEEVSRHFHRPIEVVGEEFEDRRITAWFGEETFEEVAESLCLVTEADCSTLGDGMRIGPDPEAEPIR